MNNSITRTILFSLMAVVLTITACVKGEFDAPPVNIPSVDFPSNTTIAELKAMYLGTLDSISDDIVIQGKVVANDESGNLYKKIVIQDATAGIEILLNKTSLYNEYKLGQRVFVKCKGMYLGDYGGLVQLGSTYLGKVGQLPEIMIPQHLFKDSLPGSVPEPVAIDLAADNAAYLSMFVSIDNAIFSEGGKNTYSDADATTNRTLKTGSGTITVRTSNYASFALDTLPKGYGKVLGILGSYNGTAQLAIRDTSDLQNFSGVVPETPEFVFPATGITPVASIDEKFDAAVASTDIAINGWTNQAAAGARNWQGKTFQTEKYAQASSYNTTDDMNKPWLITPPVIYTSDLKLSFKSEKAYYITDQLSVWILYNYTGDASAATWTQVNATLAGASDADYTWVLSGDINLSDYVPANYSGNIYIGFKYEGDATNTSTYCIDDVKVGTSGGGGGGGGGTVFTEDFTSTLGTFTAFSTTGTQAWLWATYDSGCAKMSGYAGGANNANEDWLISPMISLAGKTGVTLNFREAINYIASIDDLQVLVSTNYSGSGDPTTATWTAVTGFTRAAGNNWTFVDCGSASLAAYQGQNIYIAFKYTSTATSGATWEVGSVTVSSAK